MNILIYLKHLLRRRQKQPELEEDLDGSLRGHALRRALKEEKPRTGTPHDWEDYAAYQASAKRLEERMRSESEDCAD